MFSIMKNFLNVHDVPDVEALAQQAIALKQDRFAHEQLGKNKTMVLLFLNASLRTRISTQKAAHNLGMKTIVLNLGQDSWNMEYEDGAVMNGNTAEHIKEGAAVISEYADIIGIRAFPTLTDRDRDYSEYVLHKFLENVKAPIVNMESATVHPLQSLTDLVTIREHTRKARPKVVLTWAPHIRALPQCVSNSFAEWMNAADVELTITHPEGYELAEQFSGKATIEYNQDKALEGADFVYAKNWSSYRQYGQLLGQHDDWMITDQKMQVTDKAYFMHCLPTRRNLEIADDVLDSDYSLVIKEAANREFAAQAVLKNILESL